MRRQSLIYGTWAGLALRGQKLEDGIKVIQLKEQLATLHKGDNDNDTPAAADTDTALYNHHTHPCYSSLRRKDHFSLLFFKKAIRALLPHTPHFLRIPSSQNRDYGLVSTALLRY